MSTISQSVSGLLSAYASVAATLMLVRSMANELIPPELRSYLTAIFHYFFAGRLTVLTLIIDEHCGMTRNQVFDAAEVYLRSIVGPSTERLKVGKTPRQKNFSVSIEKGEEVNDVYDGGKIKLKWKYVCTEPQNNSSHYGAREKRYFELTFDKKYKARVMESYLHHVLDRAEKIKEGEKVVKLYNRECPFSDDDSGMWGSVNLEHPATFKTVAMDPEMKNIIIDDLDRFVRRKEFYKKVGKAWKRGYLLYGPPGTGKSSLIAAMANYLKFDIYDLELTSIYSNSELRRILLSTTNRSILVIEDIDCSVEVQDREMDDVNDASNTKLTLSGILNFIDGLWSSCGDERIIVFTTNRKERLDPALLRPGRMDLHIHMSYCTIQGLNILVSNYLGINLEDINREDHYLYKDIQGLINTTNVTPAEVAEELMKNDDADSSLDGLVKFLKQKNSEANEVKDGGSGKMEDQKPKSLKSDDDNDEKLSFNENKERIQRAARAARRRRPIRGKTY